MDIREEILALVERFGGRTPTEAEQADLFGAYGLDGGDAAGFVRAYADRFDVQMDGFLWYFHFGEGPQRAGRVVPTGEGKRQFSLMPIGVDDLERFARTGRWQVDYPAHRPAVRSVWWFYVILGLAMAAFAAIFLSLFAAG